jgi:SAM-dependent methyltransferase
VVSVRGFLKREGFDFEKKPHQIDRAFLKLFPSDEADKIRGTWDQIHMFGASPTKLYAMPRTLQQAHLLMSYDRERYLAGFDWIRDRVEALKSVSVLEVGTGTGVLLRYLAANFPDLRYQGIDAEPALVKAAPADDSVSLIVGDYLKMEPAAEFDLVVCNFGFDSDRFPASTTPHSTDQIGASKFCPGCSDDLAHHLESYFGAWRRWAKQDASLLLVGRIDSFGFLRAVALAAGRQQWDLELGSSAVLKVADPDSVVQRFPALQFRAGSGTSASIEDVERFYVAAS